jgi:hypothetical protein
MSDLALELGREQDQLELIHPHTLRHNTCYPGGRLALASPVLSARLDQVLDDATTPCSVKEVRRAIVSVASYLLRWQRRATPFGMFAGVGAAGIGPAVADVGVGR